MDEELARQEAITDAVHEALWKTDSAFQRVFDAMDRAHSYVQWYKDRCQPDSPSYGDADELDREIEALIAMYQMPPRAEIQRLRKEGE